MKTGKHTVTALTRQDSKASLPENVHVIKVNYDDESSIINALKGQQFLVITLAAGTTAKDVSGRIMTTAKKAGVHYIMPNAYGYPVEGDLNKPRQGDIYGEMVRHQILEAQSGPTSSIALACGFWYEFSLAMGERLFGFTLKDRKVTFFDDGKRKISVSTWSQCGRALAALLSLPRSGQSNSLTDFKNKNVIVYSFSISQRDMLDSLNRVLGTTDTDWTITYESSAKRIQEGHEELAKGVFIGFVKVLYGEIFLPSNNVSDYATTLSTSNSVLDLPKEDLDEATKRAVHLAENSYVGYRHLS